MGNTWIQKGQGDGSSKKLFTKSVGNHPLHFSHKSKEHRSLFELSRSGHRTGRLLFKGQFLIRTRCLHGLLHLQTPFLDEAAKHGAAAEARDGMG